MNVQRFDFATLDNPSAHVDADGFLHDSPVVGRIGIQEYLKPGGGVRRELRLPEEVFHPDALASFQGKPITVDHPMTGRVTAKDARKHAIGTMLASGRADGDTVRANIVIHTPDAIGDRRQLSLGYTAHVDETPGEWNGQKYDAVQRNIRVNHLSVVKLARAGAIARLNLDSQDNAVVLPDENITPSPKPEHPKMNMVKIKLDSGIEYEAPQEIAAAFTKAKQDASDAQNKTQTLQAQVDTLQAKVDGIPAQLVQARKDAEEAIKARVKLDAVAASFKVDPTGKTDREVKELIIKSVRKDADLKDKSDIYVDAALDMAVVLKPSTGIQNQRVDAQTPPVENGGYVSARQRAANYMDHLANPQQKEGK